MKQERQIPRMYDSISINFKPDLIYHIISYGGGYPVEEERKKDWEEA